MIRALTVAMAFALGCSTDAPADDGETGPAVSGPVWAHVAGATPSALPRPLGRDELPLIVEAAEFRELLRRASPTDDVLERAAASFAAYEAAMARLTDELDRTLEPLVARLEALTPDERRTGGPVAAELARDIEGAFTPTMAKAANQLSTLLASVRSVQPDDAAVAAWDGAVREWRRSRMLVGRRESGRQLYDLQRPVDLEASAATLCERLPEAERLFGRNASGIGDGAGDGAGTGGVDGDVNRASSRAGHTAIREVLARYHDSLDACLDDDFWGNRRDGLRARALLLAGDEAGARSVARRMAQRWRRIHDLTCLTRDRIAHELIELGEPALAAAWRDTVDTAMFPRLMAPSRTDAAFEWVRESGVEDKGIEAQIEALHETFTEKRRYLRSSIQQELVQAVADGVPPKVVGFWHATGACEQTAASSEQLRRLERETIESIRRLLGPDDRAAFDAAVAAMVPAGRERPFPFEE